MKDVKSNCLKTTKHIADKILLLRRAKGLTQEKFAVFVGIDTRTITRAENGKHRPSAETIELIALAYNIPISYFFDDSVYDTKPSKTSLIEDINRALSVATIKDLKTIKKIIFDILN